MEKEKDSKPTNEWSLKRIIIRLISYPFCLVILYFSIQMIQNPNPQFPKQLGYGFFGLAVVVVYISSDIMMIIKNRKKK